MSHVQEPCSDDTYEATDLTLRQGVVNAVVGFPKDQDMVREEVQITKPEVLCKLLGHTPQAITDFILSEGVASMKVNYPTQDHKVRASHSRTPCTCTIDYYVLHPGNMQRQPFDTLRCYRPKNSHGCNMLLIPSLFSQGSMQHHLT